MEANQRQTSWLAARKMAILGTAMLPFVLSIIFHMVGPQAQGVAEEIQRPALAFDQYLVNLGKVPPGPYAWGYFAFTNTSNRTVEVQELKPSCGCLNPQLKQRNFAPGESGEFLLRVQTANEDPGPKEYYCDVLYHDPQPRETRVTFKVILPDEQVIVRPKALVFYQLNGQATDQEIVVTDFRKKALRLTGVECSSELAAVDLGDRSFDKDGSQQLKINVRISGNVPAGRHRALVTIFTNDPLYPKLKVPLLIQGPEEKTPRLGTKANLTKARRK